VPIKTLLVFSRLKRLECGVEEVSKALSASTRLQLSEDGEKVRRTKPLPAVDDSKDRTAYAKGIPRAADLDEIFAWLRGLGVRSQVARVIMRRTKDKKFKGSVFLEFHDRKDAEAFVKRHNHDQPALLPDLTLRPGGALQWTGALHGLAPKAKEPEAKEGEAKEGEAKEGEVGKEVGSIGLVAVALRNEYYAYKREQRRKSKLHAKAAAGETSARVELDFKREMTPGLIVKITKLPESVAWPALQEACGRVATVAFTELDADEEDAAFLRMQDEEGARALVRAISVLREREEARVAGESSAQAKGEALPVAPGRSDVQQALWEAFGNSAPEAKVLDGADEREYWERIWSAQLSRLKDRSARAAGQTAGRKRRRDDAPAADASAADADAKRPAKDADVEAGEGAKGDKPDAHDSSDDE
jgi:hypothetical protein